MSGGGQRRHVATIRRVGTASRFFEKVFEACRAYSFGGKLVGSRAKRMKLLIEKEGASIGK